MNVDIVKVSIKFEANPNIPNKGPRIVIGENGMIQYMGSYALMGNAITLVEYNITDCKATLELCKKLDLINKVVALCYCSSRCNAL